MMISRKMTRAQEEKLRDDNRRKEYERREHMKMVAQDKLMRANMACDERVDRKIFARRYVCM